MPNSWANLFPCGGSNNSGPTSWWCGKGNSCDSSGGTDITNITPANIYKVVTDSSISTSQTTNSIVATATATPVAPQCSDKSKTTAVGTGVGVPLGILAFVFLGLFSNERRLRHRDMGELRELQAAKAQQPIYEHTVEPIARRQQSNHELGTNQPRHELG